MKKKIGNQNVLYPMPVTIVGALVNGKPNFLNIAHVGILNAAPPHLISLGMNKAHYTNIGIREQKTFSVNILSHDHMIEMDYVGLVSGSKTDKSACSRHSSEN
jgi:flavin reductase (DIM6/NTAB) family NADH-FMN oxidoreductase RutF